MLILSKYKHLVYLLFFLMIGIIKPNYCIAWPNEDNPMIENEADSIGLRFRGGSGGANQQSCPVAYEVQRYMFEGSNGYTTSESCFSKYMELSYKGGKGQIFASSCPYGLNTYNYLFQGSSGTSYNNACYTEYEELTYIGGKGQTFNTTCPLGISVFDYMFQGVGGMSYSKACYTEYSEEAYLGGGGQTFFSSCPTSIGTFNYMFQGVGGMNYTKACYTEYSEEAYLGGSGQTFFTHCVSDPVSNFLNRGGYGQTFYASCSIKEILSIHKGGSGQTFYSTCGTDQLSLITRGGLGQTYYASCPTVDIVSIHKGGSGQTFYTTCGTDQISIISRGGIGRMDYTNCLDDFKELIHRGGLGQTFHSTCETDLISRISQGGIGQMAYSTCYDDFTDRINKGGFGQTFYQTCADITSLFVRKSVTDLVSCTGRTNIFTVSVENKDYAIYDLNNISVRDSLGLGLTFKEYSLTAGTYNPATGIWLIPSIEKGKTHTLTIKASSDVKGELTNYAWIKDASIPKAIARDTAYASVLTKEGGIPRSDIRAQVFAKPERQINLSSYLDTMFQYTAWNVVNSPIIDPSEQMDFETKGLINTQKFKAGSTYSYWVRVEDECLTDTVKAYIKVLDKNPLYPEDRRVRVCFEDQKTVNLSAIIGIDAGLVEWMFNPNEAQYLTISSKNAAIYNAEKAWFDTNITGVDLGNGRVDKTIVVGYKIIEPGSVLENKIYTLSLVITNKLIP